MSSTPKRKPDETSAPARAKVFWSGRSQAVRLPKQFRVESHELRIHRQGRRLVLEPPNEPLDANGWPVGFFDLFGALDEDFDVGDRQVAPERRDPLGDG